MYSLSTLKYCRNGTARRGSYGAFCLCRERFRHSEGETKHHREPFMSATAQAHMELDMRVCLVDLDGELHDLRGQKDAQALV